jgi:DNA-binding MarR family transcriptional regulator
MALTSQNWQPTEVRQEAIQRAHREWMVEYGEEPRVSDLATKVGVAPSTISLQLKRLRAAGVDIRTRGPRASRKCRHCGEWS